MAYVGGKLASFFRDHGTITRETARRIADQVGDELHDKVVENTPIGGIDNQHGAPGGNLRSSWYRVPTKRKAGVGGPEYRSEVATNVRYADDIERGWGLWGPKHAKYLIKPKKPGGMLRWRDRETGQWIYARKVEHPGAPGQHMMAVAAAYVEVTWGMTAEKELEEWRRAIERQAD